MNERQKNALETKAKLLAAGTRLINEKGFQNVSVQDITDAAGVSKGTFYVYFKRKEDFVGNTWQEFANLNEEIRNANELSIEEKLTQFCSRFMKIIGERGLGVTKQWVRNVVDDQYSEDVRQGKYEYDRGLLQELLQEAVNRGELKAELPVEATAQLILTQLYGSILCWCLTDGGTSVTETIDSFCNGALKAMLALYKS